MLNINKSIASLVVLLSLCGCGAIDKTIKYGKLEVVTKMSSSIFLDPVQDQQKTMVVQIRNTSDQPGMLIEQEIKNAMINKGYRIVSDAAKAHYMLQANVLQIGKQRPELAWQYLSGGWGSALGGAVAGATLGGLVAHNRGDGALVGGLLGGAVSYVSDSMVEVVNYTMITDLQISEKSNKADWKRYQTRVVSVAQKTNLKFADAEPALKEGLVKSISGMF